MPDMSFAIQALGAEYLAGHGRELPPLPTPVPKEIDEMVARTKLAALGVAIDTLTPAQQAYIAT